MSSNAMVDMECTTSQVGEPPSHSKNQKRQKPIPKPCWCRSILIWRQAIEEQEEKVQEEKIEGKEENRFISYSRVPITLNKHSIYRATNLN